MKSFEIPSKYHSDIIKKIKNARKLSDPRKKDFSPTMLDFGPVRFLLARHFGFCYGVENAIERSYRAVEENPGRRIFLLSQMIHNPHVNADLEDLGIRFIMDTKGNQLIDWSELQPGDVVMIPAFGTTLEIEEKLRGLGVEIDTYNTTCPFVERVWNRSAKLGEENYTVIIHGKPEHEETRATFSHSKAGAPAIVVRNMEESQKLGEFITGDRPLTEFYTAFAGRFSEGFDPEIHLGRVGVVNQTTMLATETQAIADYFKQVMIKTFGPENLKAHFADTRDTLCYATNDNQQATLGLREETADLALVVGGYNSSNTSHLVDLFEEKYPTYFIKSEAEIASPELIHHFNYPEKRMEQTSPWLPAKLPVTIILSSGASCPDVMVDAVLKKVLSFFEGTREVEEVVQLALQPA